MTYRCPHCLDYGTCDHGRCFRNGDFVAWLVYPFDTGSPLGTHPRRWKLFQDGGLSPFDPNCPSDLDDYGKLAPL